MVLGLEAAKQCAHALDALSQVPKRIVPPHRLPPRVALAFTSGDVGAIGGGGSSILAARKRRPGHGSSRNASATRRYSRASRPVIPQRYPSQPAKSSLSTCPCYSHASSRKRAVAALRPPSLRPPSPRRGARRIPSHCLSRKRSRRFRWCTPRPLPRRLHRISRGLCPVRPPPLRHERHSLHARHLWSHRATKRA
jgi:hypothetical protein